MLLSKSNKIQVVSCFFLVPGSMPNSKYFRNIAYLVSEYPSISHTFIFREIQTLRGLGFCINTASIRKPKALQKMTEDEQKEAKETLYIKTSSFFKTSWVHIYLLLLSPGKFFFMLKEAILLTYRGSGNIVKGFAYFLEAGILIHWMHQKEISHVHVHFANPASTVALIASKYGTILYSISFHGPDVFYNVDAGLLSEKIKMAIFSRCISYYCQSQLMRLVPHEYWSRFGIVRCGVDPEVYLPRPEPKKEFPEILCVGRLVPAKGQHILIKACSKLKNRGEKFHLTFVGDGEDYSSLQSIVKQLGISDIISFTGAIGQEAVHRYYNQANIFVLASFAEGVPVVLMEAMAKEIASISTLITGIPELIEDGKDGVLVAPSNINSFADKLQELLNNKPLRRSLGKNGRQKVLLKYNLKENCKLMADLFMKNL